MALDGSWVMFKCVTVWYLGDGVDRCSTLEQLNNNVNMSSFRGQMKCAQPVLHTLAVTSVAIIVSMTMIALNKWVVHYSREFRRYVMRPVRQSV